MSFVYHYDDDDDDDIRSWLQLQIHTVYYALVSRENKTFFKSNQI